DGFWPMHDQLLHNQDALRIPDLLRYAAEIGLDVDRFEQDLRDHTGAARIDEDVDSADLSGVSGTPTFFINGRRHYGAYDIAALSAAVRAAGARAAEKKLEDAAAAHGLYCWLWLGDAPNLPTTPGSTNEQLLGKITDAFKAHPGLGAYKGFDEPRNPFRGDNWIRPAGLERAKTKLARLDPDHPVVIIQAPPSPLADLVPYQGTFDVTGADIFPVSYPPGAHMALPNGFSGTNRDISLVGD